MYISGNLTREMQVSNAEFCTLDMNREEDFATSAQILDVTITA
jgi:hypothetical protein